MKVAPAEATFVPTDNLEAVEQIVRESVLSLWDVVDNLTRLRPERSRFYHVTIFGSARIRPQSSEYKDVRKLAEQLAKMGCRIVTGGGPGLMQAANAGANDAHPDRPEASIGIRIDLEHEQTVNAFVGQAYRHRTFFSRLHHFVLLSNAFVVMPGGIGTTLELAMVWQLLQVRKLYGTPLILVGEMWEKLVTWAREYMVEG
ncbi:MAG TPA: LOG family protein, partial [Planctomycetia bacterium]|nr:LOG family protein [Planctomycetia bacterium]